jgi:hypothetical protein
MNTDATTISQPAPQSSCLECQGRREGFQIYTARVDNQHLLAWDVELAWTICADGRTAIRLHRSYLDEMLRVNQYSPAHLEHIDPAQPGIACAIDYTEDLSPVLCLIDGTHRAARCVRDGISFFVYMLTEEESVRCQHTAKVALYRAIVGPQAS